MRKTKQQQEVIMEALSFGELVREKRLEQGITLRALAAKLNIAPAYMCDIENDRRYPPEKEKIDTIANILQMNNEERNSLFDAAASPKKGTVSPDLTDYVMSDKCIRVALRKARDIGAGEKEWERILRMLESKDQEE